MILTVGGRKERDRGMLGGDLHVRVKYWSYNDYSFMSKAQIRDLRTEFIPYIGRVNEAVRLGRVDSRSLQGCP